MRRMNYPMYAKTPTTTRTADTVSAPNLSKTNDNVINNELHDLISIAEIEAALSSFNPSSTMTEDYLVYVTHFCSDV